MNVVPMDFETLQYHPLSEKIVDILQKKTQSNNTEFFRILTAYSLAKIASTMRTNIATHDRGTIPVNVYAVNLAPSGTGKGYATNIIEENLINPFKDLFLESTFQSVAENSLRHIAHTRAMKDMDDEDVEYEILCKEFESLGHMLFSFDSGTTPAVKQMRQKLLMAGSGALSLEMDELGSNLLANVEVFTTFLELYDVGKIKEKLIKNTSENKRLQFIEGKTPANLMMFGTPNKVMDGGKVEDEMLTMFDTGFGRRCIFGYARLALHNPITDPDELYDTLTNTDIDADLAAISEQITKLAEEDYFNINLAMSKATHIYLLKYKIDCTMRAVKLKEYQEMQKAEMEHRYYKALKLAGTYAFIDGLQEVTAKHIEYAIKLVEESGKHFAKIIAREKPYERLARYIAEVGKDITQVDLLENLPFFKGSDANKRDMISLATAFGYKNNIIIRKSYIDEIEFYRGETLEETNLEKLKLAYSVDSTTEYDPVEANFFELDKLLSSGDYYFTAHHFKNEYRNSAKAIPGFNMIVLDIDEGTTLETAQLLLKNFTYKIYTTKRHSEVNHRFRIILPISHTVKLNTHEYAAYMENVFEWLPFTCDLATKDIARKWATTEDTTIITNENELLDATLFIPQTKKSEQIKQEISEHTNLGALENWFLRETREGNRSNMLLKYGMVLKDAKYPIDAIRNKIDEFNKTLDNPLDDNEISKTIMISIARKMGTL